MPDLLGSAKAKKLETDLKVLWEYWSKVMRASDKLVIHKHEKQGPKTV